MPHTASSAKSSSTFANPVTVRPFARNSPFGSFANLRMATPWHSAAAILPAVKNATNFACRAVALSKLNIGAWPPATTMASNFATSRSATEPVSSTRALSFGVWMKPWLMRSDAE